MNSFASVQLQCCGECLQSAASAASCFFTAVDILLHGAIGSGRAIQPLALESSKRGEFASDVC